MEYITKLYGISTSYLAYSYYYYIIYDIDITSNFDKAREELYMNYRIPEIYTLSDILGIAAILLLSDGRDSVWPSVGMKMHLRQMTLGTLIRPVLRRGVDVEHLLYGQSLSARQNSCLLVQTYHLRWTRNPSTPSGTNRLHPIRETQATLIYTNSID